MNRNVRIAAVVGAALLVVVLVIAGRSLLGGTKAGSDGTSSSGASETAQPAVSDTAADAKATDDAASQTEGAASGAEAAASSTTSEDESYEALKEQLLEELDAYQAPVGANARDAAAEEDILTVAELSAQLGSRGFPSMDIIATFTLDGSYQGETVLDPNSAERYPSYRMDYQSSQDVRWAIVVNGRAFLAVPLAAADATLQKEIILSETDVVVQFDGSTGQYSDFGFDNLGDAVGITVAQIDKATLDSYTGQELGEM